MLQECSTVHSRKCETVYDEECQVHYQYGRQCKKVPRQECKDVAVSLLQSQYFCSCVFQEKKCSKVPHTKCEKELVDKCKETPKPVGQKVNTILC